MSDVGNDRIVVHCQSCQKRLKVPSSAAGRKAKCPDCGTAFRIPESNAPSGSTSPPAADDGKVRFNCEGCGARMKVPSAARGKRVKCPKCSTILTVPAAEPPPRPDPDDDLFGGLDDDGGLLDDLAAAEHSAEALAQPNLAAAAPPTPLPDFNQSPAASASGGGGAARAAVGGIVGAVGPFALGCIFCAVGALIGAGIWCGVAMATQYEIGWIAWGLGGLAGLGMHLGYRQPSSNAGLIAAVMSVAAIFVAKGAIFYFVTQPFLVALDDPNMSVEDTREAAVVSLTDEMLTERGVYFDDGEDAYYEEWDKVEPEARKRVDAMSDAELRERTDKLISDVKDDVRGSFFTATFGLMDLLFVGLAVATAFRIGAYGISQED